MNHGFFNSIKDFYLVTKTFFERKPMYFEPPGSKKNKEKICAHDFMQFKSTESYIDVEYVEKIVKE